MTILPFSWFQIIRLGFVQMSIGGIVVLTTSTLNRIMVVELMMPALLPGVLVALHYLIQIIRPRMGFGADKYGKCTPWIMVGMAVLCFGGILSTFSTVLMYSSPNLGIFLAFFGFLSIGLGVSASGTALLTLLAKRVDSKKRASAATIVWLMMIAGFALTAGISGYFLDPFTPQKLLSIASIISVVCFLLTFFSIRGLESEKLFSDPSKLDSKNRTSEKNQNQKGFYESVNEIWKENSAKKFTIFIFISMLAFSMQDLILEPFAGTVFEMTPGQTTSLSGIQHSGVLVGMILVALFTNKFLFNRVLGSLKMWIVGGCLFSAVALFGLVLGGINGKGWLLEFNVFVLGVANGSFSIAAIATMMQLAKEGRSKTEGTRIGLWGASQAIAFALGGFLGAISSDIAKAFINDVGSAYAVVFFAECMLFFVAAKIAQSIEIPNSRNKVTSSKTNSIISSPGNTT